MEACLGPLTAAVTTLDNRLGRRPRHLDSVDTETYLRQIYQRPENQPTGLSEAPLLIHRMESQARVKSDEDDLLCLSGFDWSEAPASPSHRYHNMEAA